MLLRAQQTIIWNNLYGSAPFSAISARNTLITFGVKCSDIPLAKQMSKKSIIDLLLSFGHIPSSARHRPFYHFAHALL